MLGLLKLFTLAILSLASVAPSSGWAQGSLVQLTDSGVSPSVVAWSPDGTKIAFVGTATTAAETEAERVVVMNADGTNFVQLGDTYYQISSLAWSPDGTKVAYAAQITRDSFLQDEGEIFVTNADGTNRVQLTRQGDIRYLNSSPAWSPDGTKIAFVASISRLPLSAGIDLMDADGTNRVDTEAYESHSPAWSPDGTKIAFITDRSQVSEVYVMDANGENLVRLTQRSKDNYEPVWSPDGTKIAFASYGTIHVMNADGTNLVQLTQRVPTQRESGDSSDSSMSTDSSPVWSPDGTKIAFESDRNDNINVIYVMNADGTNLAQLTGTDGLISFTRPAWSPDGTKIAFVAAHGERDGTGGYSHGSFAIYVSGPAADTERGDRRATLLNLSPRQAWVHLYCLKDQGTDVTPCAVTFECNGQSGDPVTWPVEVAPKTIFSYWPNKTASDGTDADLQAALIIAGKPEDEARRRTTCEVFSPDPLTVRGYTLFGELTLVPVAEPARPDVAAAPGERRRRATLPNLSPWQAWVHLYCLKDRGTDVTPCAVTFECNGQSGDPVTWPVEVAPKTIFAYWPNKTVGGLSADLQTALIVAGKMGDEAGRRMTCEVSSADPIAVRGYTRFGGQPTLVPVTAY